jgi:RNA polymerase sigma-70 factor, ECF subfamily
MSGYYFYLPENSTPSLILPLFEGEERGGGGFPKMNKHQRKFSKIYNRYADSIYRFIYIKVSSKETAEDLTSEVFLKTWRVFHLEENKEIKNPRAFLYASARNLVIDHYRAEGRTQIVSIEDSEIKIEDTAQSLEKKETDRSDLAIVQKALARLKPEYQDVIILKHIDGLSTKEIAEILVKSKGAVRIMLHRAMEQLKATIDNDH